MNTRSPTDVETLLRSLSPESLSVNRDELFFQAGYAAGANQTKRARLFWPSAAAALLLACIGLSVAVQRQTVALHTALAAAERAPEALPSAIVSDDATKPKSHLAPPQVVLTDLDNPILEQESRSEFDKQRLRSWEKLATADFRRHGRLTARGLVEAPENFPEPANDSSDSPTIPRSRPKTYLELRQQHLEG